MKIPILSTALLACTPGFVSAAVSLPACFADHMVLQRNAPVPVWGKADPGESVTVEFAGQSRKTTADAKGQWSVRLDALKANAQGGVLTVHATNAQSIKDVLVGEVWLASGQSNMAYGLSGAHNAAETIPAAGDEQLRFFQVKTATSGEPQPNLQGTWKISSPATAGSFSAVAYFFARELRQRLGCPVGILQAAWGGTPAQCWLSVEALRENPPLSRHLQTWDSAVAKHRALEADPGIAAAYKAQMKRWNTEVRPSFDAAMKVYNTAKWAGQEPGPKPVAAWPEPANPDPMGLPSPSARPSTPGVIFNAMIAPLVPYAFKGVIWYQGEANASAGLEYRTLFPRLIGDWRKHWQSPLPFLFVQLPGWEHSDKPASEPDWPWLREAQLLTRKSVPNTGMAIAIDVGDPSTVHPTNKLDVGLRLALLARQIAYGEKIAASGPLYEGFTVQNAAIRIRFTETHGGLVCGQAPWLPKNAVPLPGDHLVGFEICGADKAWVEAAAVIEGETVVVSSPKVPKPVAVRYGWANAPRCNLYNRAGLPASPFRTAE